MENAKVGRSGIVLGMLLLMVAALADADDKKKTTSSPAPRPAQQVSRPVPQAHTPPSTQHSTSTYRPPTTGTSTSHSTNTYHQNTTGTSTYRGTTNVYRSGSGNTVHPATGGRVSTNTSITRTNTNSTRTVTTTTHTQVVTHASFHEATRTTRDFGDRHVSYDRGGRVRDIRAPNMVVHHDLRGGRTFVAVHNGRTFVSTGVHRGYMQHAYLSRGSRVYVQRTYVVGGVSYARVYRSYSWNGGLYYHYVPGFYYRPAFYGWAYRPWGVRVTWGWGWYGAPWYGYYGYYFTPYPVYPSASLWLTDYLLAENLKLAYASQQDAGAPPPQDAGPPPDNTVQLSPEVKQMIADEVQRQLAAEQNAAGNPAPQPAPDAQSGGGDAAPQETPSALDPNSRVFVVSSNLDVVKEDGSECSLTPGDVIIRTSTTAEGTKVSVNVITSKRSDCPSNTNTAVDVSDLQEMQNQFREQMDQGLKTLADNQGKNGLPSAPDTSTTGGEVPQPAPDASAQADLQQQQKSADQADQSVPKSGGQQ